MRTFPMLITHLLAKKSGKAGKAFEKCQRPNYKFWYKEQWAGKISFHAAKRGRGSIKLPELPEARGAMVLGQLATLSSSMQSEGRAKLANNISWWPKWANMALVAVNNKQATCWPEHTFGHLPKSKKRRGLA